LLSLLNDGRYPQLPSATLLTATATRRSSTRRTPRALFGNILGSIQGADRAIAELILKGALAESVRSVLFVAALLALGASAGGLLIPRSADIEGQQ
jgi:hypothetical protein